MNHLQMLTNAAMSQAKAQIQAAYSDPCGRVLLLALRAGFSFSGVLFGRKKDSSALAPCGLLFTPNKSTSPGVDSPFFSTIVLFNHQLFPLGFRRFSRKIRIPGKLDMEAAPTSTGALDLRLAYPGARPGRRPRHLRQEQLPGRRREGVVHEVDQGQLHDAPGLAGAVRQVEEVVGAHKTLAHPFWPKKGLPILGKLKKDVQ